MRRKKPLKRTPMRRESQMMKAARLYRQGHTETSIAAELGCHHSHVSRLLAKAGVETRGMADYFPFDADRAVLLYESGEGLRDVAREVDTSIQLLRKTLHARGVPIRKPGRPKGPNRNAYETEFKKARRRVRERSGGRCEARGPTCTGRAQHCHHRKRRGRGGTNELGNLLDVCQRCHEWIHSNVTEAIERGWLVHSWED